MSEQKFDPNQGHGNHWDTVSSGEEKDIIDIFRAVIQDGVLIGKGSTVVDGNSYGTVGVAGKNTVDADGMIVIMCTPQSNEVVSGFPTSRAGGLVEDAELVKIDEYSNGIEAVLTVEVNDRPLRFFDSDYYMNKANYHIGERYDFTLAAFAYRAEIVPESARSFEMTGDDAIKFRTNLNEEVTYDENGNVEPIKVSLASLVALLQHNETYPDDGEFQSPVKGGVSEVDFYGTKLYRIPICVHSDHDDEHNIVVPLFAKAQMFEHAPQLDEPIRGHLWLTGQLLK